MKKSVKYILIIVAFIIGFIIGTGIFAIMKYGNPQEYTVNKIDIQTEIDSSGTNIKTKYLYFCTLDSGDIIVFENEDRFFIGKFDSSTILAQLTTYKNSGKSFKIQTRGYRIPFLTMYQNIIKIQEAES